MTPARDGSSIGNAEVTVDADRKEAGVASEEERKRAFKAFKKKLKLTQLDDESGLSRFGSKISRVAGITPPPGFPPEVWEELAKEGKLKREGNGIYGLAGLL